MPCISLIIPTRNEEETIEECIRQSQAALATTGMKWEILVVDSSTDGTADLAEALGAIVIKPDKLGYGNAYLYGFGWARGDFIVIMDGDLTYDPAEIPKFIKLLEDGADLVIGSRLRGDIRPGAMPALHRYIGNPLLTGILNILFAPGISDAHCGMRAITRDALRRLDLKAGGMEFASEMMIEAAEKKLAVREIPISYRPRKGESKLNSFRDGWRHLRFMMLYRPGPFLMLPGAAAMLLGIALYVSVLIWGRSSELRMHTMILGSLLLIAGYQTILTYLQFTAFGASYGVNHGSRRGRKILSYHSLEKELMLGLVLLALGFALGWQVLLSWIDRGFGSLYEVQSAMMALILCILGLQTVFSGMFISLLLLKDERDNRR
ncbi:MAG: Glycosyltransferase AglJ [Methanosaeta sp. PtaB.Bin039]|nr:MAG: Glycosyltransferase AglJ [Methanosaeta sp. PtaB.Bin039]